MAHKMAKQIASKMPPKHWPINRQKTLSKKLFKISYRNCKISIAKDQQSKAFLLFNRDKKGN